MRNTLLYALMLSMSLTLTACSGSEGIIPPPPEQPDSDNEDSNNEDSNKMKITIGSTTFHVSLASNPAAAAFKGLLPMTIELSELNNNEKYYGLPKSLPTSASNPGTIQNGDLMLYGSSTLVLFYKTFSTSYSYTRIGSVDNPSGLQSALGAGSVMVTFE